jgi:hypothetical protein
MTIWRKLKTFSLDTIEPITYNQAHETKLTFIYQAHEHSLIYVDCLNWDCKAMDYM